MITVIKNYTMQDIKNGILLLLDLSSKSELVRNHAFTITEGIDNKIPAVYSWVKENLQYVKDPETTEVSTELFISPVKQIEWYREGKQIYGDCDDHALLSTALYRALNMRSRILLIDSGGKGIDHAYCEVWSEVFQRFISVDTTAKYPLGWTVKNNGIVVID